MQQYIYATTHNNSLWFIFDVVVVVFFSLHLLSTKRIHALIWFGTTKIASKIAIDTKFPKCVNECISRQLWKHEMQSDKQQQPPITTRSSASIMRPNIECNTLVINNNNKYLLDTTVNTCYLHIFVYASGCEWWWVTGENISKIRPKSSAIFRRYSHTRMTRLFSPVFFCHYIRTLAISHFPYRTHIFTVKCIGLMQVNWA